MDLSATLYHGIVVVLLSLSCAATILLGFGQTDTPRDRLVKDRAPVVCKQVYGKCVKKITKLGPGNYRVLCG